MFLNVKKPVIRKVSVRVEPDTPKSPKPGAKPGPQRKTATAVSEKSRQANGHANGLLKPQDAERQAAPVVKRLATKRRKPSPSIQRPQFSSSDSESEDSDVLSASRKRVKTSGSSMEPDTARQLRDQSTWTKEEEKRWPLIHGADLTSADKEFKPAFIGTEEDKGVSTVELRYPSVTEAERFELVIPQESDGYTPLEDIIQTITHICQEYLPESQSLTLTDDTSGIPRRLKRAITHQSVSDFKSTVEEFNSVLKTALSDGTIDSILSAKHALPLPLIERILSQVYSRTVSPRVRTLRQYENGTDNVYGELLPRFIHQIFIDTSLTSTQTFVDLGSGVGNVVLQAALQVGCESWGIEQMPNPSALAELQATEFRARCHRWGLSPGSVHLLKGDFLATPEIDAVLKRADVILVNNQAFNPDLNDKLLMKFLDVKEGARIVSLKSFVPQGWKIKERNVEDPRNLLSKQQKRYWSGSVSWTDGGGEYFVQTKDSSMLQKFLKRKEQ